MPRRVMREFKIDEISAVDSPAQKGARATILKRGSAQTVCKGVGMVMVEDEDGHQHLLDVTRRVGETSFNSGESNQDYHVHPYTIAEDGTVTIGTALGHTHDVDQAVVDEALRRAAMDAAERGDEIHYRDPEAGPTKRGEPDMTVTQEQLDEAVAKAEQAVADLEKAQAENERLGKIAALSGTHKAHFDTLEGEAADEFLNKDEGARDEAIEAVEKAATDADPVVYKADDGTEYRKSDDPRMIKMAQDRDADRRELAIEKAARENDRVEKRATAIFKHATGETAVHVAMVKALEGIADETIREGAFGVIEAYDKANSGAFETYGHVGEDAVPADGGVAKSDAEAQLDKLAKAHAEKHGVDYATAYTKVLETSEGHELYKRTIA